MLPVSETIVQLWRRATSKRRQLWVLFWRTCWLWRMVSLYWEELISLAEGKCQAFWRLLHCPYGMQVETDALQMELCPIQAHRVEIFCPIAVGVCSLSIHLTNSPRWYELLVSCETNLTARLKQLTHDWLERMYLWMGLRLAASSARKELALHSAFISLKIKFGYWSIGGRISSWDNAIRYRFWAKEQNEIYGKSRSGEDAEWGKAPEASRRIPSSRDSALCTITMLFLHFHCHCTGHSPPQLDDRLTSRSEVPYG